MSPILAELPPGRTPRRSAPEALEPRALFRRPPAGHDQIVLTLPLRLVPTEIGGEYEVADDDTADRLQGLLDESTEATMASLQPLDVEATAEGLRRLLDAVRSGQLVAGSGDIARLEGALAALEALLGQPQASRSRCSTPDPSA